jgi:hypothetical protein
MPRRSTGSRTPAPPAGTPPPRRRPPAWPGARRGREVVDRAARVAKRGSRDRQGEEAKDRKAVQRTIDRQGLIEQRKGPALGNKDVGRDRVVAAGPAQAAGVPGVKDLELAGRDRDHTQYRPVGFTARTGVQHAACEQIVGVVDPAAVRPTAGYPHAAVDRASGPARRPHTGGDGPGVTEDLHRSVAGEVRRQQAARGGDRHAPAGRGITLRDRLRAAQGQRRGRLGRAECRRGARAQQTGGLQVADQVVGQATVSLGAGGMLAR